MDYEPVLDVLVTFRPGVSNNFYIYGFTSNASIGVANADDWNLVTLDVSSDNFNDGIAGGQSLLLCGGYLWLIGGWTGGSPATPIDPLEVYRYEVATKILTAMSVSGPAALSYAPVACVSGNRILLHEDGGADWLSTDTAQSSPTFFNSMTTVGTGPDVINTSGKTYMTWDGTQVVATESAGGSADINVWLGAVVAPLYPPIRQ